MSKQILKDCPFCGDKVELIKLSETSDMGSIKCKCGMQTGLMNLAELNFKWNCRAETFELTMNSLVDYLGSVSSLNYEWNCILSTALHKAQENLPLGDLDWNKFNVEAATIFIELLIERYDL